MGLCTSQLKLSVLLHFLLSQLSSSAMQFDCTQLNRSPFLLFDIKTLSCSIWFEESIKYGFSSLCFKSQHTIFLLLTVNFKKCSASHFMMKNYWIQSANWQLKCNGALDFCCWKDSLEAKMNIFETLHFRLETLERSFKVGFSKWFSLSLFV